MGDGGSGGDPHGNGQKLGTLLGKVLRIDVDSTDRRPGLRRSRPTTRSSSTESARPEIFALGLRNPWRLSFDRETGDLWIGDVGQGAWEEIDVARAGTSGANFGWNRMEGAHCFRPSDGCDDVGTDAAGDRVLARHRRLHGDRRVRLPRDRPSPTWPAGTSSPTTAPGTIWAIDPSGDALREPTVVSESGATISSFGEDEAGELYVTDLSSGELLRVVAVRAERGPGQPRPVGLSRSRT